MEIVGSTLEYKALLARQWWGDGYQERAVDRSQTLRDPVARARHEVELRRARSSMSVLARWIERNVNEPARSAGRSDLVVPVASPEEQGELYRAAFARAQERR